MKNDRSTSKGVEEMAIDDRLIGQIVGQVLTKVRRREGFIDAMDVPVPMIEELMGGI